MVYTIILPLTQSSLYTREWHSQKYTLHTCSVQPRLPRVHAASVVPGTLQSSTAMPLSQHGSCTWDCRSTVSKAWCTCLRKRALYKEVWNSMCMGSTLLHYEHPTLPVAGLSRVTGVTYSQSYMLSTQLSTQPSWLIYDSSPARFERIIIANFNFRKKVTQRCTQPNVKCPQIHVWTRSGSRPVYCHGA